MSVCKYCNREYVYDKEEGYSREHCSVMCDYSEIIKTKDKQIAELKQRNAELEKALDEHKQMFGHMAVRCNEALIDSNPTQGVSVLEWIEWAKQQAKDQS